MTVLVRDMWRFPPQLVLLLLLAIAKMKQSRAAAALPLETVKIRGCWSLTRLPEVSGSSKAGECDCEKEWWDRLECDGDSRPSHYKPTHSRYYKKTMLRGSVLR
jgi:hypothetical protein